MSSFSSNRFLSQFLFSSLLSSFSFSFIFLSSLLYFFFSLKIFLFSSTQLLNIFFIHLLWSDLMIILKLKLIQTVHKKNWSRVERERKEKKKEKKKEKENCGLNTHERYEFSSLFDEESTFRVFPSATFFFLFLFLTQGWDEWEKDRKWEKKEGESEREWERV